MLHRIIVTARQVRYVIFSCIVLTSDLVDIYRVTSYYSWMRNNALVGIFWYIFFTVYFMKNLSQQSSGYFMVHEVDKMNLSDNNFTFDCL